MKATITPKDTVLTLEISTEDLAQLTKGIGRTSVRSRVNAGMEEQQAELLGDFYFALVDAYERAKQ